jgi:endo-1,4-beta-xylanase
VPVTVAVSVTDRCDPSVSFELVSITSNEAENGQGDGNTTGDIQGAAVGTPDTSFLLRAERSGQGDGRVYTIVYRATDGAGNSGLAAAYVHVPKHR